MYSYNDMKTITLKNINRKSSFARIAEAATVFAHTNKALVRFEMGPAKHRQTFVASPKKSVSTLCWEWAKSTPGMMAAKARKVISKRKASVILGAMAVAAENVPNGWSEIDRGREAAFVNGGY